MFQNNERTIGDGDCEVVTEVDSCCWGRAARSGRAGLGHGKDQGRQVLSRLQVVCGNPNALGIRLMGGELESQETFADDLHATGAGECAVRLRGLFSGSTELLRDAN